MSDETKWIRKGAPRPEDRKTSWTQVRRAQGKDEAAEVERGLLALTLRPLIFWWAGRLTRQDPDARDQAQGFLLRLLRGEFICEASPEKGRLSGLVVTSLTHVICDWYRSQQVRRAKSIDPDRIAARREDLDAALDAPIVEAIRKEARTQTAKRLEGTDAAIVFAQWVCDPAAQASHTQGEMAVKLGMKVRRFRYLIKVAVDKYEEELRRRTTPRQDASEGE